ncbi:MAG: VWA domain-containing protein [Myxococcales bacterium]|nr:VWA domain-containing protein [Myxococcales bacterium]
MTGRGPARAALAALLLSLVASCAAMDRTSDSRSAGSAFGGQSFDNNATPTGSGLTPPQVSTNVSFGGAQDVGFMRGQLEQGLVPSVDALDAPGFFAEHHIELPSAACGQRICLQPMLAVMGNLINGNNCTMLHLGLNSPIAADPGSRPPLSLAVVVDVSGSMVGRKLDFVRDGLSQLIDGLRDVDELAIITYSDAARVLLPMTGVELERASMRQAVETLQAGGATNLSAGLVAGYREVLANFDSGRQNRVILLSDGNPTAGETGTAQILDTSWGYNSDGIGLTTIGLGADFNIDLMRSLAQQADGNFYFLEDVGAVDEVFQEELSFFVVPVALDLELSLTAGESYEFGRALGAPMWTDAPQGGFLELPGVFIAHRESADDVTADDGRRGGGSSLLVELMPRVGAGAGATEGGASVATVELSFRDPTNGEMVQDVVDVRYPFAPGELVSSGFFEAERIESVQKSFVMLNIYVGMETAIRAFHSGEADTQTMDGLENLIAAVEDYNDEVGDKDVELDLELLQMLRDNLGDQGLRSSSEVVARDPWPAD